MATGEATGGSGGGDRRAGRWRYKGGDKAYIGPIKPGEEFEAIPDEGGLIRTRTLAGWEAGCILKSCCEPLDPATPDPAPATDDGREGDWVFPSLWRYERDDGAHGLKKGELFLVRGLGHCAAFDGGRALDLPGCRGWVNPNHARYLGPVPPPRPEPGDAKADTPTSGTSPTPDPLPIPSGRSTACLWVVCEGKRLGTDITGTGKARQVAESFAALLATASLPNGEGE